MRTLIFDGNFMAHRARHATGRLRNGIAYGMIQSMFKTCQHFNTNKIIWVFDAGRSQARMNMHEAYKTGRGEVDGLLSSQVSWVETAIRSLGAAWIKHPGTEADDVIAVLAKKEIEGKVTIVSSDKDFLQLIDERITVWNPISKKEETFETMRDSLDGMIAKYRYLDVKSLVGDPSDSIDGIKGFGWKTAVKACKMFDSFNCLPVEGLTGRMSVINEPESIEKLKRNHALMSLPYSAHQVDIEDTVALYQDIQNELNNRKIDIDTFEVWVNRSGMSSIKKKIEEWKSIFTMEEEE